MFAMESDYSMFRMEERWKSETEKKNGEERFEVFSLLGIIGSIIALMLVPPFTIGLWPYGAMLAFLAGSGVFVVILGFFFILYFAVSSKIAQKPITANNFDWWASYGAGDELVDYIVNELEKRDFKSSTVNEDAILASLFKGAAVGVSIGTFSSESRRTLAIKLFESANRRVTTSQVI